MLKMVDGTGILGVDMISPLGVSTPQPPNYDRVELEGAGMLVLPNSLNAPLERLELGGKTEQVTTSGKNLFDFSNLESGRINISTGALEEHNHTRRLADYINITDITSYSIYLPGYNKANGAVYVIIYYYDKDKNYLSYKPCGDKIEKYENITPVENAVYIKVSLEQNTIDNPQNIFKVQLEKGAKSTAYEPYTGGKPSPNPEYPQEIKSVGKWNEEKQKYEVDVKITGKNLFDIEKAEASGGNLCTAKCENNIVKITAIETTTSKRAYAIVSGGGICLKAGKTYFLNGRKVGTSNMTPMFAFFKEKNIGELLKAGNFYTPNEDICIDIGIYLVGNAIGTGDTLEITDIIVCEGKDAAQYQPYTEQTITLTSDRPITKWDRLVEKGGEIGWLYGTEKYTVSGSENYIFGSEGYYSGNSTNMFMTAVKNMSGEGVCYRLKRINGIWDRSNNTKDGFCINSNDQIHMRFYNSLLGVSDDATKEDKQAAYIAYLKNEYEKGTPYEIVYQSSETEFIPLPQSEQNAIRALKTYYPTTVITADGGELDPDIKVTYRKEI